MTVRTRLLAVFLGFVGALLVLGSWSAWHLWRMSVLSERIIADNYVSVVAAQDMKESLERQDSAALFVLLGRREQAVAQLREHRARFDAAFDRAARNVTEPGEAAAVDALRRSRDAYYATFDRFTQSPPSEPAASMYFAQLQPPFDEVRRDCDRLLTLNQDAMRRKSRDASSLARRWFVATVAAALALVAMGVGLAGFLARRFVRPIQLLTEAAERVASGNLDTAVVPAANDELGILAVRFNEMAGRIREYRRADLGRVRVAQRTAKAAIESLYDPIVITDAEGLITRVNRAAEPLLGSRDAIIGRALGAVAPDPRLTLAVTDVLQSQQPAVSEESAAIVPLPVEGETRAYRQRTTPMRGDDASLLGAVMILEDVTHLREIDRVKSEFISVASHELRTPVTSLQMGVHLLLEGAAGDLPPRQRDIVEMCRDDTARLDRLVKELLDMSRLESGSATTNPATVAVLSLIELAVEPLKRRADEAGLILTVAAESPLPPVFVDRSQIERVLTNLVGNAIRATPRGGRVEISATARQDSVVIAVSDTGRGIPHDYLARIFDPFVQVPDAPSGGAGLGLSISQRIVHAHGGQIWVRSEPGRGTTFTFTLPAVTAVTSGAA